MTREEKISRLKDILAEINEDKDAVCYLTSEDNELIESAIEALEQQPCEDCISRADVKKYLSALDANGERIIYESDLDLLPPVQPKPKTGWIPVKFRPLTDKEQEEYPDYCYIADCPMPDDGEEILVSTKSGRVEKDECGFDDGYYLDSGYDWQTDIVAWMPLPESYEPQESEGKK